jgi:hypothetical protein
VGFLFEREMLDMTTQRVEEEIAYTDLAAEMEQMRQFSEGVTTGTVDPTDGGNDPQETPSDDLEEGEEDDGADLDNEEPEDDADEADEAPDDDGEQPEVAPVEAKLDIQFHEREVELLQREAAAKQETTAAQVARRTQQLDTAQFQLRGAISEEYGMDDEDATKLAASVRESWDAYHNTQDQVAEFTEWFRMGVRTSYVLGQKFGVDPKILFPDNPDHLITFKEMTAKAEELGGTTQLKRENQKLREASAPRQQFARNRGTTSGRTQSQLVDSGMNKPEHERTPQEKEAIRREATGS